MFLFRYLQKYIKKGNICKNVAFFIVYLLLNNNNFQYSIETVRIKFADVATRT